MLPVVYPQAVLMLLGLAALTLVLGVFFCLVLMRYLPAAYLLNRYPEQPCGALIRQGVHMMKGHLWEGLWLQVSFLGWLIAAGLVSWLLSLPFRFQPGVVASVFTILVFPIPFLFVAAYRSVTNLLFCQYAEDSSRLRDGQAPYAAYPDEEPFPSGWGTSAQGLPDDSPRDTSLPWDPGSSETP